MKRSAALAGLAFLTMGAAGNVPEQDYGQAMVNEMYDVPAGAEAHLITPRWGLCGSQALLTMKQFGYTVDCGEYRLTLNMMLGCNLKHKVMLTDMEEGWTDGNCDGNPEGYHASGGLESLREGQSNSEMLGRYVVFLLDMNTPEVDEFWGAYISRHMEREETEGDEQ
ncbi:MAG TPA: hypothetical protein HA362_03750 [Nanoarchaeota archaeon]|nr:hypothetical protein [Nanoarchaeota archaeon]